jgi:hypothetical protein
MDMDDLQKAVKEEAERVFRHLAVDYITKHDPQADVSQTYRSEYTSLGSNDCY